MGIASFLTSWEFAVIFYVGVALVIYLNRDKFDFQGKIVALYRTKIGIDSMKKFVDKVDEDKVKTGERLLRPLFAIWAVFLILLILNQQFGLLGEVSTSILQYGFIPAFILYLLVLFIYRPIKEAGKHGIIAGYLGMAVIVAIMGKGLWNLVYQPEAAPMVTPIIPGFQIPGVPVKFPLWYTLAAIFIAVVIHEFSHGLVSKSHGVKVNSSGFVLFGPLPGAFVEPDEEELESRSGTVQNSVFAAGPFSNIVTAILVFLLVSFALFPLALSFTEDMNGVRIYASPNTPAAEAGIPEGEFHRMPFNIMRDLPIAKETGGFQVTQVNGQSVSNLTSFNQALGNVSANQTFVFSSSEESYTVTSNENGRIGIQFAYRKLGGSLIGFTFAKILLELGLWVYLISLGLGLANLLPIGPVDGGRMYQIFCRKLFGEEKGDMVWGKTSVLFLVLIVILLVVPILQAVLP